MNYVIVICAIVLELLLRLLPTKLNLSILDKIKNVALQLHSLIDIIIPNNRLEDE